MTLITTAQRPTNTPAKGPNARRAPQTATRADLLVAATSAPGSGVPACAPAVAEHGPVVAAVPGSRPEMAPGTVLRPYQRAAVDEAMAYLGAGGMAGLIVLPTGSGKSVCLAEIARRYVESGRRALVATHSVELVSQDAAACERVLDAELVGVNAAGLGRRDSDRPVTIASIQSIFRRPDWLGRIDLVMVDEAHQLNHSDDGMYAQLLANIAACQGPVPLLGLTATPFRMRSGRLVEGWNGHAPLFETIVFQAGIRELVAQGWLVRPVAKGTLATIDTTGVTTSGGEFSTAALARVCNVDELNRRIAAEIVARGTDRRSWLIFCVSVDHAEAMSAILVEHGIPAAALSSATTAAQRRKTIDAFRSGEVRALCSMNILTTGFDAPATDLIALCRPTMSPGLHCQMLGRGMRPSPGKIDALILDFAANVTRHGPLDLIDGSDLATEPGNGDAPVKSCPGCQSLLAAGTRECPDCGHEFAFTPRELKLVTVPIDGRLLSDEAVGHGDWLPVVGLRVTRHVTASGSV